MIGIGHRLEKQTRIKILAQKAKDYNMRFNEQVDEGIDPTDACKNIEQEEYNRRHQEQFDHEPYKKTKQINNIGGVVNLRFNQAHKTKSQMKQMQSMMQTQMQSMKQGKSWQQVKQHDFKDKQHMKQMKKRIRKDHLQEDVQIDLGQKHLSDQKRNFIDTEKMKEIRQTNKKQFNQRKNDLKWYAQTYIKTKDSLCKR